MQPLKCDKPYNLDEAAARRGAKRRKRKDSRTTAYELTIRIPEGSRRYFGGKKKLTRVVFALNKKVDLKGQAKAFEDEKNAELELALEAEHLGLHRIELLVRHARRCEQNNQHGNNQLFHIHASF